jgi:hypothetical protein
MGILRHCETSASTRRRDQIPADTPGMRFRQAPPLLAGISTPITPILTGRAPLEKYFSEAASPTIPLPARWKKPLPRIVRLVELQRFICHSVSGEFDHCLTAPNIRNFTPGSSTMICPHCKGRKHFRHTDNDGSDYVETCEVCDGTGTVSEGTSLVPKTGFFNELPGQKDWKVV